MQNHLARPVLRRQYRGFRLAAWDDGGAGWTLRIYAPHPKGGEPDTETLRNHVPAGLPVLIEEAQQRIDRRLHIGPEPL